MEPADKAEFDRSGVGGYELAIIDQNIGSEAQTSGAQMGSDGVRTPMGYVFVTASASPTKDSADWTAQFQESLRRAIESTQSARPRQTVSAAREVYEQLLRVAPSVSQRTAEPLDAPHSTVLGDAESAAERLLRSASAEVDETLRAARTAAEADLAAASSPQTVNDARTVDLNEGSLARRTAS